MAKKKYYVGIREVHVSTRLVEAETPEEALDLAVDGEELTLEYNHTSDRDTWTVQEDQSESLVETLAKPSRRKSNE